MKQTKAKIKDKKRNEYKKGNNKNEKAITLIALVVTIIVLLILAGVSIATLTGENGILTRASEAEMTTELSGYKEELELYKQGKYIENNNFLEETLTAGKENLTYNTQEQGEEGNIKTIITSISDEYLEKLEIIKGKLLINTQDIKEIEIAQRLGIEVNPYDIVDGVLESSNGNLLLMDKETGSLTIPDSVTTIGEGAFANVEGLKTIIIPSTVKRIEQNAFRNNSTLETVIMQEKENADRTIEGVQYIGNSAFQNCKNLTTVQMANSVAEVGIQVFYNDSNLIDINLSKSMTYIANYMFGSCVSLTSIEIPEGITEIGSYAFNSCSNLTTTKLPKSVTSISSTAFSDCFKLTNIDLSGNTNFSFEDGILLGNNKTEMIIILKSAVKGNTFIVPDTVTKLANAQINQYTNITKVEIPASVTNIDSGFITNYITEVIIDSENETYETDGKAIYTRDETNKALVRYYDNETNVKIDKNIKIIKENAFYNKRLNNIELPDTLENIEAQAFAACNNLKSLELGVNVNTLSNMSIYGSGIEKITFRADSEGNTNPNYSIRKAKCNGVEEDALFSSDGTVFISPIKPTGTIITYEIPEGVEEISTYAFHYQNQMTNIMIPNTVEKIGSSFNFCYSLQSIEIPSSVKEMDNCFAECINLTQIRIHTEKGSIVGSPWGCIYGDKAVIWDE